MEDQKKDILEIVEKAKAQRQTVTECLSTLGIKRPSYYRWRKKSQCILTPKQRTNSMRVTPEEEKKILESKEKNPLLRHRKIQGELQKEGLYVSYSTVYRRLKANNLVEPYARREAPWDEPHYEIYRRCVVWGADWTKLRIGGVRWYLLTLIDFFSRVIEAHRIVPTVNGGIMKALYLDGLANENVPRDWHLKPELHLDQGSPNKSRVLKEFFKDISGELSFARVRRPTDNAITERFYGTIKQEEIYVVGDYPDLKSAEEEIGRYIKFYNEKRPHQALWNFTPAEIHDMNNKTEALKCWRALKTKSWGARKNYWRNDSQNSGVLSH